LTANGEETEDFGWRHIQSRLADYLRGFNRYYDKDVPNATFIQWEDTDDS